MKFCSICENMLYSIEEDNNLFLKCKNCGFKEEQKNAVVITKVYKDSGDTTESNVNKYLIHDPTLPRTCKKKCPNVFCTSNQNKGKQEAVFFPIDSTMKLVYICIECNTEWKYS